MDHNQHPHSPGIWAQLNSQLPRSPQSTGRREADSIFPVRGRCQDRCYSTLWTVVIAFEHSGRESHADADAKLKHVVYHLVCGICFYKREPTGAKEELQTKILCELFFFFYIPKYPLLFFSDKHNSCVNYARGGYVCLWVCAAYR